MSVNQESGSRMCLAVSFAFDPQVGRGLNRASMYAIPNHPSRWCLADFSGVSVGSFASFVK